jgi:hypothetical protein
VSKSIQRKGLAEDHVATLNEIGIDFDPYSEKSQCKQELTTMFQIATPQSTPIPIPLTRGVEGDMLREVATKGPLRTGNFSQLTKNTLRE